MLRTCFWLSTIVAFVNGAAFVNDIVADLPVGFTILNGFVCVICSIAAVLAYREVWGQDDYW